MQLLKDLGGWAGEKIVGLVVLGVVYLVINGVLVGGQELWHSGGRQKLAQQKTALEQHRQSLDQKEQELRASDNDLRWDEASLRNTDEKLDTQHATLAKLKSRIEGVEKRYPAGIPPGTYQRYLVDLKKHNSQVGGYNALVKSRKSAYAAYSQKLDEHNTAADAYKREVDAFNQEVEAVNKLASSIGGKYYLVPVPRFSGRRR